jgi:cyanate permease
MDLEGTRPGRPGREGLEAQAVQTAQPGMRTLNRGEAHRKINTRMLILYLLSLITIQAIGILYFLRSPSALSGLVIGILVGALAPVLLAAILVRIFKVIYRAELG